MQFAAIMKTPFAMIGVRSDGDSITDVVYLSRDVAEQAATDRIAARAAREIERYLGDADFRFTVPLAPKGTQFQHRVWHAIRAIPLMESRTYGELARQLRTSARAVGQACGANRIALIIPCHRVVGSRGSLGGFMNEESGDPLAIKRWLLTHEGYRFGA